MNTHDIIEFMAGLDSNSMVLLEITHKEILEMDFRRLIEAKNSFLETHKNNSSSRLYVTFDGYNDDPRELYEIEEVRKYILHAFCMNAELFYYLHEDTQDIVLASIAFCEKASVSNGIVQSAVDINHIAVYMSYVGATLVEKGVFSSDEETIKYVRSIIARLK